MTTRILDYLSQPDAVTCQSTAIAKVTGGDIRTIRQALLSIGVPGDPMVMGQYLKPRVKQYKYSHKGTLRELEAWVTQGKGYEAIVHGFTTGSGHVWGVESAIPDEKVFICDDPWSEFDFPSGKYLPSGGKNVPYSYRAMQAYCVEAYNYWQAVDAYAALRGNQVDMDLEGGWFHYIQN